MLNMVVVISVLIIVIFILLLMRVKQNEFFINYNSLETFKMNSSNKLSNNSSNDSNIKAIYDATMNFAITVTGDKNNLKDRKIRSQKKMNYSQIMLY